MPYIPDDQDELYRAIVGRVEGRTEKLTNFDQGTLNHALLHDVYAGYYELYEHALLAMQLSGWIDYAGGPINEEDLVRLDIPVEEVDLDLLNEYMDDADLDAKAAENGVTRDPGDYATGEVEFRTHDDTVIIPEGIRVATSPDRRQFSDEEQLVYRTTEETTPDAGTTTATAPIEAVGIGPRYNVGANTITTIPSPPVAVREVTNPEPVTGGEARETNDELRARAKGAISRGASGGTTGGIIGGLVALIDGLDEDDVHINEHYNPENSPPYVEVTVDGGDDQEVEDAIDALHPPGIRHILNRPLLYYVEVDVSLAGAPINIDRVESEIGRYLSERGIGEDVNRATLITAIVNADEDIENVTDLIIRTDRTGTVSGDLVLNPDEKAVTGAITVNT